MPEPTSRAQAERAALADLLQQLGPDVPTLCEGWAARDLAAHLVIRERRPDAALGILVRPLAGRTVSVQADYAGKPWPELVALLRDGPPMWSPLALGPVDRLANTIEFFVHHEDVRRAQTGWTPRPYDAALERELWRLLEAQATVLYRKARVGVVLRRDTGEEVVAKATLDASDTARQVTVEGPASELVLHALGRTRHARVRIDGDPEVVRIFSTTPLGA